MAVNLTIKVLISTSLYESPKYLARRNGKFVNAGQLYTASNDPDIPGWYYVTDVGGYVPEKIGSAEYVQLVNDNPNYTYINTMESVIDNSPKEMPKESVEDDNNSSSESSDSSTVGAEQKKGDLTDYSQYSITTSGNDDQSALATNIVTNLDGVFGMPYQYMNNVDRRISGGKYGWQYADKIVSRIPLLLLSPGHPKFLKGYSDSQKEDIFQWMIDKADNSLKNTLDEILNNKDGNYEKYYSFEPNYSDYYKYVNPMCRTIAQFLGVGDEVYNGVKIKNVYWQNQNTSFRQYVSAQETIGFYIDAENQVSESFSNSTRQSMIASSVNNYSDMARELEFLLGGVGGMPTQLMKDFATNITTELGNWSQKWLSKIGLGSLVNNLAGGINTIINGGKLLFPEIWSDSSYSSPTMDITIKLRCPDPYPLAWFLDIAVPLMHLIALCAPRSMGANSYKSPQLVRGYYKGFFNCNMGIIGQMNITRGDRGKWTVSGLPTQVDVNFTIKDLYSYLSLSQDDDVKFSLGKNFLTTDFIRNTYLLDYLSNLCGININKPDIFRTAALYQSTLLNDAVTKVTFNEFSSIKQAFSRCAYNRFERN